MQSPQRQPTDPDSHLGVDELAVSGSLGLRRRRGLLLLLLAAARLVAGCKGGDGGQRWAAGAAVAGTAALARRQGSLAGQGGCRGAAEPG